VDYPQLHCRDESYRGDEYRSRQIGTESQQRGIPHVNEWLIHGFSDKKEPQTFCSAAFFALFT
jgi:hypothetical protein